MGMRRASAAEEDAAQLRARLEEAQKEAKDLGWQVGKARVYVVLQDTEGSTL